jgi:thioredoxin-related protein
METGTFPRRDVQDWLSNLVCMRVNAGGENGHPLATKFGVEGFPTIVLIEPTGRVLYNQGGAPAADHFVDFFAVEEYNKAVDACNIRDPKGAAPHLYFVCKWFRGTTLGKKAEEIRRSLEKEEGFEAAYEAARKSYEDALATARKADEERAAKAREAERREQERREKARAMKAEADELHRKYLRTKAYDLYRKILKEYPDLPEAAESRAILEKNKQRLR